jgi:hypothetical protein
VIQTKKNVKIIGPPVKIQTEDLSNRKRKCTLRNAQPHSMIQDAFLLVNIGRQINIFVNAIA